MKKLIKIKENNQGNKLRKSGNYIMKDENVSKLID